MAEPQINQEISEEINNLEKQKDRYALKNWEHLKEAIIISMCADIILQNNNSFSQNYDCFYQAFKTYFLENWSVKALNREENKDTLDNCFNNIRDIIEKQKELFPDITNNEEILQIIINTLIDKHIEFFYEHYQLQYLEYTYFNTQGITDFSLHFEINIGSKEENILRKADYIRNKYIFPESRRFMSNLLIAGFYNRNLLETQDPPNEKELLYWIAFDYLIKLNNEEKTKLAQLLNTNDNSLSKEQREIKDKILNNDEFKDKIITNFKQSFQKWPKDNITEITLENVNDNLPDKNHVVYILHAPEENLSELEKQFKIIFLANPIQEIYAQFYKNLYNVDEVPNDKLLTEKQIDDINRIPSKVQRSSLIKYKIPKLAKNVLNDLYKCQISSTDCLDSLSNLFEFPENIITDSDKKEFIINIMQNPKNLSEDLLKKNQKAIERINEIKKLTFLYKPEENFPNTLTESQETALTDLYNSCFHLGDPLLIPKEEKIESLKYTKENYEFFNEKIENPEFTILGKGIKEFITYKEDSNYDTKSGLTKKFNNLPDSKPTDISQYLPGNFNTSIENFDPKLPSNEESNTDLENLFKNTLDKIEAKHLAFEKWRPEHQINQITEGQWENFFEKGNGFLKAVCNGELNTYFNEQNTVKILSSAITAKLSRYPKNIKYKILIKIITSKKLSPEIKYQLCIDNNIKEKKYWPKILGIIAGITLGILGIGIALATGGIGAAILGTIGTIIASHTAIFTTVASIGIAIGIFFTSIFSKKVNEAKSINTIINPKSRNGYTPLVDSNETRDARKNLNNDTNTSIYDRIQDQSNEQIPLTLDNENNTIINKNSK